MSAPLFGLRWVPDSQLRPLRYLPSPPLHVPHPPAEEREEVNERSSAPLKLQQHVITLTQRLQGAEESIRQKSEQIRWLKEMTKDEARRAKVSRWISGPLMRTFSAWKRHVREVVRKTLAELEANLSASVSKQRELHLQCDELTREHGVLQAALEHFYTLAARERTRRTLRAVLRRWGVMRALSLRSTRANARRSLLQLRYATSDQRARQFAELRARDRLSRRHVRQAFRALLRRQQQRRLSARAAAFWPLLAARASLRWMRSERRSHRAVRASCAFVHTRAVRDAVRRAWARWASAALLELGSSARRESLERRKIDEELAKQASELQASELEARRLRMAKSLWGEDELPQMLQALDRAALSATASGKAEGAKATWQGTQLHLCVSALDSLKRQLARERAAVGIARDEAKQSDSTAEKALAMLQQVRAEEAELQQRLASLEAANAKAQQLLRNQEEELFESRRAHRAVATKVARHLAQLEEACTRQMRGLEARCEEHSQQVLSLQEKVSRATNRSREHAMNEWARALMPARQ